MAVTPADMGLSDAQRAYIAVQVSIDLAMHVAAARVTEPAAFPLVPQAGVSAWLTRKALADLLELGFTPDGWESAYLAESLLGGGA